MHGSQEAADGSKTPRDETRLLSKLWMTSKPTSVCDTSVEHVHTPALRSLSASPDAGRRRRLLAPRCLENGIRLKAGAGEAVRKYARPSESRLATHAHQ